MHDHNTRGASSAQPQNTPIIPIKSLSPENQELFNSLSDQQKTVVNLTWQLTPKERELVLLCPEAYTEKNADLLKTILEALPKMKLASDFLKRLEVKR